MSLVTSANTPGREGHRQRAHEPQRQPPRAVGAQHAQQQPDVAGDDPRDETHPVLAPLRAGAQFAHAAGHGLGQREPFGGALGLRQVAEHVPDQADDRLDGALAHRDRAERGHGQDRDAMGRADMGDHRTPRGLQREVGHAHRQVPAALEEHPAPRRDQLAEVRRRLHQPVGDELDPPPDPGQLPGEPVGDLPDQALGQLRRGSRCGQQADDQLRLRFGVRNALRARALRHDPIYHHGGHVRQVGRPPTSPDRLAGRVVVRQSRGVQDDGDPALDYGTG